MERTKVTPIPQEIELNSLLDEGAKRSKELLLEIMRERRELLPGLEVYIDNKGLTESIKAIQLHIGSYEADTSDVYISEQGMYWTDEVSGGFMRTDDRFGPFLPAWHSKKEVEAAEYLSYANKALSIIQQFTEYSVENSKTPS